MAAATNWAIRGSYFESCNCDPICPCPRINDVGGGRSTHGVCGYGSTFSYSGRPREWLAEATPILSGKKS